MKVLLTILLAIIFSKEGFAQTFNEWFRQKKTQQKYLLEQIVALKVYTGFLQKGYQIAKGGLCNISDLTGHEFGLHGKYFLSLSTVNPIVRKHPQIKAAIAMQKEIDGIVNSLLRSAQKSTYLGNEEKQYIRRTVSKVLDDCERVLDELITVLNDGNVDLKDEERIKWIERIHGEMESNLMFSRKFGGDVQAIHQERNRQQRDVETGKKLNGLK